MFSPKYQQFEEIKDVFDAINLERAISEISSKADLVYTKRHLVYTNAT